MLEFRFTIMIKIINHSFLLITFVASYSIIAGSILTDSSLLLAMFINGYPIGESFLDADLVERLKDLLELDGD